ncbi:MAG: HDOD domain-containing protein [Rhodoferax sp.]|uniref:HDOD domain-containing protein n=1 Tax=Rhodoferax sp. TaxID=50421 RepID=UPI0026173E41|nr:HDOD domain-containing protein [Rhodoferax sp.]MDD2879121.1 HDOD domain-containing protein [Rhodoferax sp.]
MNTDTAMDIRSRLLAARLPSPPQTLLKLLRLCQEEDVDIRALVELIASDPALSAKVLLVAHSAAYHAADAQALTLLQASSRLGTALIKVLALSVMVTQTFNGFTPSGGVDLRAFWKHSLGVALLSRELAARLDYPLAEEAYLAGLLHDIGRLALLVAAPQQAQPLFLVADDDALCAQEHQAFGLAHAAAGAWLLGRWHLSEPLIASVLHHHDDSASLSGAQPLTQLVHLAHRLAALQMAHGKVPDAADTATASDAFKDFTSDQGLPAADLLAVTERAAGQLEQMARDLGIDISESDQPSAALAPAASSPPADALQTQLVQELFDRSVLNEMAMTLIAQGSNNDALTQLRQHASALLQLEDVVVMLLRSNQQQLVPASMNAHHQAAAQLTYDVANDAIFASCVATRKVVFTGRNSRCAIALLNVLAADELVLIPLISARNCLGLLAAAVPAELSRHMRSQTPLLQAFGIYAGLALARRRQATMSSETLSVISRQEQRLGLMKLALALNKAASPLGASDPCSAVSALLQKLKVSRLLPDNIKLHSQLANQAPLVRGSFEMVQLVALLLIRHAFERMPKSGELTVSTGALAYRHGAKFVALSVSDTTTSSAQAMAAQLHEPPTSSANSSDAAAPNLAEINRLIEALGGHLSFKCDATGTRFDVLLPSVNAPRTMPP